MTPKLHPSTYENFARELGIPVAKVKTILDKVERMPERDREKLTNEARAILDSSKRSQT
jgi:hypothetical protein